MAGQSRPETREEVLERTLKVLLRTGAMNIFAWLMMIPARPEMMLRVTKGNAQQAAKILASLTTAASIFEFLATPSYGRLSDRFGRRVFLASAPLICALGRLNTFLCADGGLRTVVAANWVDRFFSGGCFPVYLTVMRASMTDMLQGEELTKAGASFAGIAGLAVALAPFTGSQIIQRTGNPKHVALAAAAVSMAQFLYVLKEMPETLEVEKRRPIDWAACNPLNFLRFYTQQGAEGAKLRILSTVAFLQAMPVEMHDTRMVLLRTKLGFGMKEIGYFMLGNGAAIMFSGEVAKAMITRFGQINSTFIAMSASIGALLTYSLASRAAHVPIAQVFNMFEGGSGVASMITSLAAEQGMGKGEIAASLANQVTLTKVVVPLMYANLFARFGQKAPFSTAAIFVAVAALLFRTPLAQEAARDTKR